MRAPPRGFWRAGKTLADRLNDNLLYLAVGRTASWPMLGWPLVRFSLPVLLLLQFGLLSGLVTTAWAQKLPGLGYAYPPVVVAGQTTEVQLGGFDFTDDLQWFTHADIVRLHILGPPGDYHLPPPPYWTGPRASTPALPIPREVSARIEVDVDTPPGLVRWQVANANGASETAVLLVSRSVEILEQRSRDFPQRLPVLPVAVSGRLSRLTEVDRYELVAQHDGLVSVDVMARRLGAEFNAALRIHDADGRLLADFADTQGVDGGVTIAVKAGRTYTISLNDIDFRGDRSYVYRLNCTAGPRVVCTLPARGERGATREVAFIGYGVASGEPRLESFRQSVTFPQSPDIAAFTHRLETPYGSTDVVIPLSDLREEVAAVTLADAEAAVAADSVAAQVGDTAAAESDPTARVLQAPVAVTDWLPRDAESTRYVWDARQGEYWSLRLQSRAIGGRLDVALEVLDPEGKQVAQMDDLPGTPDVGLELLAAASGAYTCVVRGVSSRTGAADEVYRLEIQRSDPDFALRVPQRILLPTAGKATVDLKAERFGGFAGEIHVSVSGLPDGVTTDGEWTIPAGKNELKASLQSDGKAAVVAALVSFQATANLGPASVTRDASATAAGNLCPCSPDEQQVRASLLAMTMPPPFEVRVVDRERQRDVPRGTTYLAPLQIVRDEGFEGEIQLHMTAAQSRYRCGIRGPITIVPEGATSAEYPCFMPEWLGTELTRRIVVHGVAAVPDPKGNLRYLTKQGDARITMILEGALLKLSSPATESTARLGEVLEVPVVVSRSIKLPLAAKVELKVPPEIAGLMRADPLELPPGQDRGVLRIHTVADARLEGPWSLRLAATALRDGKWPVVSEFELPVVLRPAP